ncbi:type I restriction enzyme HsdR N-terminal domain-containing protein [Vibrio harveyi]|nr:type I restriction enzyme HsdR N-terminal domain-containing protein [Vibrio harveyi]
MEFKLTDGRINEKGERLENKRADYYLFHNSIPLAIIEAKKNTISSQSAIQQAINYANMIDCPFAFASNGDTVVEHDRLTGEQREFNLDQFPTKEELIERYKIEGQISNEE